MGSGFVEMVIGFWQWIKESLNRILVFLAVDSEFVEKVFGVVGSGFRIR